MEGISYKNYDLITELPVDKEEPTPEQLKIVNTLFKKENKTSLNSVFINAKDAICAGILFIIFSIPQVDTLLGSILPITTTSVYISVVVKALIVVVLFWVIKYFILIKKILII
jgi:hypothetical protein